MPIPLAHIDTVHCTFAFSGSDNDILTSDEVWPALLFLADSDDAQKLSVSVTLDGDEHPKTFWAVQPVSIYNMSLSFVF